jgi:RNA polymerase sigma factor (sigma-70 family)
VELNNETTEIIQRILNGLAYKYTCDIYDVDDIKQEGFLIAVKILESYDPSFGAMENFLRKSLSNRLKNFRRNKDARLHRACTNCEKFNENCPNCIQRHQGQEVKKNLLNPIDIYSINDNQATVYEGDLVDTLEMVELIDFVNKNLPVEYRQDYLKIKEGLYVPKARKEEIEKLVTKIMSEYE